MNHKILMLSFLIGSGYILAIDKSNSPYRAKLVIPSTNLEHLFHINADLSKELCDRLITSNQLRKLEKDRNNNLFGWKELDLDGIIYDLYCMKQ